MSSLISARSDFSMGSSILPVKTIAQKASELGYEAVAMTDDATISGMTALFQSVRALEQPIKAIIGVSIAVYDDPHFRPAKGDKTPNRFWEAKLYVKNETGLKALFRLLSVANSEGYFYYRPRIGIKELVIALKSDGLILSTGDFYSLFQHEKYDKIYAALEKHVSASNRFIELVPVHNAYFDKINRIAAQTAAQSDSRILFSRPALYEQGSDDARDVMSYIIAHSSMERSTRSIPYNRDFIMLSQAQMDEQIATMLHKLSGIIPTDLIDNSGDLIAACEYEWHKQDMCLPNMADDEYAELVALCKIGFKERLKKPVFGYIPEESQLPEYLDRLKYELSVLKDMGFCAYFLLVRDVIVWSKEHDILVGPARGSAAGSLVAYLIGITDVDPLRFGLIFERFLNPERLDYPDIDTDFMSSRRHEVIDYLVEKYGQENVGGISNYTTLAAAGAIRDVGRIFGFSQDELRCTRAIEQGSKFDEIKELPEIQRYAEHHPDAFAASEQLVGKMRSLGRHAAGIVVAGEPLIERAVVETRKGETTVNWSKKSVEDFGLIKLDILGLSTLDIIQIAVDKIETRHKKKLDLLSIPLDDPKVLEMFAQGKTIGVFQFTGAGMRNLLKSMAEGGRKLTFEDVCATTALFRPGPLGSGMTEEYVKIKQGILKPHYDHPKTEDALKETRGVLVYQEQTMQLARDLAGFTMAESDSLRKAIGKKDKELMAKSKDGFIKGVLANTDLDESVAEQIWQTIESNGEYQFNKSHSYSYTLISYICQYLKCYYPAEFYAATLSVVKEEQLTAIVRDAAEHGVHVVPPDINYSTNTFEIGYDTVREQHILYAPLNRVKQVSEKGTLMILNKRAEIGGRFESKEHFLATIEKIICNKRAVQNLDDVGAFAAIEADQLDARHPDRLRSQKSLIPNLMLNNIKADRRMDCKLVEAELTQLCHEIQATAEDEEGLSTGIIPVIPNFGAKPAFMLITDCASFSEDQSGQFATGKSFGYTQTALNAAELRKSQGYYTAVVKAKKKGKQLTNEEINFWYEYLQRELELLKPSVIICAGGAAIRALCPDIKGGWEELAGQVVYDAKLDCSIFFAPNPQMVYVREDVQDVLNQIFIEVREAIE